MNKKLFYIFFLLVSWTLSFAESDIERTQELITSIENAIPARLRDPIGLVENESWTRHPDFKKLQGLIAQDWEKQAAAISTIAPSDNAKTIYYKAAQVLDRGTYLEFIMATSDRMAASELHPMQFKWVVFPHQKHLRNIWVEDPPSDQLKKVAARVREVMTDDLGMVRFMNEVISGQVAANNRDFHPDTAPLPKPTPPQAAPSTPTLTPPSDTSPPPVVQVPAPVAPASAKSFNPLWWITGAVATLVAVGLALRRKKFKP